MGQRLTWHGIVSPQGGRPYMNEAECEAVGGHCYERTDEVFTSSPPTYERVCKHCGKRQLGKPCDSMDWTDV